MSQIILSSYSEKPNAIFFDSVAQLQVRLTPPNAEFERKPYLVQIKWLEFLAQFDRENKKFYVDEEDDERMRAQGEEHAAVLEGMAKETEDKVAELEKERVAKMEKLTPALNEKDAYLREYESIISKSQPLEEGSEEELKRLDHLASVNEKLTAVQEERKAIAQELNAENEGYAETIRTIRAENEARSKEYIEWKGDIFVIRQEYVFTYGIDGVKNLADLVERIIQSSGL